jgi:hypothetical protein
MVNAEIMPVYPNMPIPSPEKNCQLFYTYACEQGLKVEPIEISLALGGRSRDERLEDRGGLNRAGRGNSSRYS